MHFIRLTRTIAFSIITSLILVSAPALQADDKAEQPFQPNDPQQAKPNPPLNQLKQILQGIFGKKKPAEVQLDEADKKRTPDYYRYPQDLEQERRFKSVQQLLQDEQWEAAREKLQLMLENSLNLPVHIAGERGLITDRELIYELLELLPEEEQQKFERQYAALAEKMFNDAQQNNAPPEQFAEIATRFSSTAAGARAMNYLISYHMERKEFGLAEQYVQRLLKYQPPLTRSPQWKTKAAYILKQTGNQELARQLMASSSGTVDLSQPIQIGGSTEKPLTWLEKQQILGSTGNQPLDEWPMLFGSPSHAARAQQADPLLIPRWSYPLTSNHSIQSQLDLIQEDLASSEHAAVPALPPLAIDGKIVFRTLKGVQVIDAATGAPLWQTALENSPEESFIKAQLKGQQEPEARRLFDPAPDVRPFSIYNGTDPDAHPLTSLIYRNANWGSQSSDGERLFILESMRLNLSASGTSRNLNRFRRRRGDFEEDFWSSNQLVAYDLQTGQPLWKVGGVKFDEPFDLPLAGTFFFGAPTPSGNELYIIGERDREIRVYALNPQTGEELWSQQIGNPEQDIALDMVRRWWIAPVAVDQGILICPTTIGLVTAIGQLNHSILWSTRYTSSASDENGQHFNRLEQTSFEPLNHRWSPSAPIIIDSKVVYTPPDDQSLICLDLITGLPAWTKRAKEAMVSLAGVADGKVLMVGMNSVTAIDLKTGKNAWQTLYDKQAGAPSGQAVIADQHLHVPLQSGQVWTFDVASGKVVNRLSNASTNQPLGNLIVHHGQFLSLSPRGLVSYEQKQTFENQIQKIKQQNPNSPLALFKEAELLIMNQRYQAAWSRLQQLDRSQLPAADQKKFHDQQVHCLTALIRSDFQQHDELVTELQQQVSSESERLELQRLLIERARARHEFSRTLSLLKELGQAPAETFFQNENTEVQIDCWIAGQAEDLWSQASKVEQEQFTQHVNQRAAELATADSEDQQRFLRQFGFHTASIPVLRQLIDGALASEEFFTAELWLSRLIQEKQPELTAEGLAGMVRLCLKHELDADAQHYLQELASLDSQLRLPNNQSIEQFMVATLQTLRDNEQRRPQSSNWRPEKLKLIVGGSGRYISTREQTLDTLDSPLPFFRTHSLTVDPRENRLAMTETFSKRMIWSTPLRSMQQARSSSFNESELVGHNLVLQHRDMLHLYDLVDRKLIWSQKLEREQTNRHYSSMFNRTPAPLGTESSLIHRHHPSIVIRNVGMIAAANADYTCYYSRRNIILVDTRTGQIRWTHENVDQDTRVLGDDRQIYLVSRNREVKKILRVSDGQERELPANIRLMSHAIYQGASNFVGIIPTGDIKHPIRDARLTSIFAFQPGVTHLPWTREFDRETKFAMCSQHFLAALTPAGELKIVDLRNGQVRDLGTINKDQLGKHDDLYVVADRARVYLVGNSQARNTISVSVPSVPTNGSLTVFDRQTGKQIWTEDFEKKHLVLDEQNLLPITLLVSRDYLRTGNRSTSIIHLKALDKQTGKTLLDWKAPLESNIRDIRVDYEQKMMEILMYNAKIHLYDADVLALGRTAPAAPENDPAKAAEKPSQEKSEKKN